MQSFRWIAFMVSMSVVVAGCDRKAKKADESGATEQVANQESTPDGKQADGSSAGADDTAAGVERPDSAVGAVDPALLEPAELAERAPETFKAKFQTSQGDFTVQFHRPWAPHGVDRAYNLIKAGYYDGVAFFRVVDGFMAQFGIHNAPRVNRAWKEAAIEADPVKQSNTRGMVTFAQRANPNTRQSDPSTRTVQLFINYGDNSSLDKQKFAPIGKVIDGMKVVDHLYAGYGSGPPNGPNQQKAMKLGGEYLRGNFPNLDHIETADIVSGDGE